MLSLHPFTRANIALVAVSLVGDVKGEWYSDSATEALDKARDVVTTPDTYVDVYDTDNTGERTKCTARISYNQISGRHTWRPLV